MTLLEVSDSAKSLIKAMILLKFSKCSISFETLSKQGKKYMNLSKSVHSEAKLVEEIKQFSHDIKSPLAVLEYAIMEIENLDSDLKRIALAASKRIFDLVNKTLDNNKYEESKAFNVSKVIDELIMQKKAEFLKHKNLEISLVQINDCIDTYCNLDRIEFERAISNLINNAFEAITINSYGKIHIELEKCNSFFSISIIDNGCGISEEVKSKLLSGKQISTKQSSALGFHHAKIFFTSNGGDIRITSPHTIGTKISITVPICQQCKQ